MEFVKKIRVEIEGRQPLVMHKLDVNDLIAQQGGSRRRLKRVHNAEEEAKKAAYWSKDNNYLVVPTRAVFSALKNAARYVKVGRFSAQSAFLGTILIEPDPNMPLLDRKGDKIKDYEVFTQPLVINNSRVPVSRPKINEWKLQFTLIKIYDELADNVVEEIVKYAGTKSGLLEHRPQKGGYFGTFKVNRFEDESEST